MITHTLFERRELFQIGSKAARIDIPPDYSAGQWSRAIAAFREVCRRPADSHVEVHTLHEDQRHFGVYYSWGLANSDGAWFIVHGFPENTKEDVQRCARKIRTEQDVVRLRIMTVKQWVDFRLVSRHQVPMSDVRSCGSAHCRGGHIWLDEGTPLARLSPENCGALQGGDRSPEQLEELDAQLKAFLQRTHEGVAK